LLLASAASAQNFEHRGSLGLTIAGGGEYATAVANALTDNGFRGPIELGGTLSVTEHTELRLAGRLGLPTITGSKLDYSAYAGIRNSRGERFKTFFDLELAAHFAPLWTIGVRVGFGVQYEFLPVFGAFAVQFRTYILP
jgi:hypothetical protein